MFHPKPCPNCGHCPTCGRSNFQPYYVQPWWGVIPPYQVWSDTGTYGVRTQVTLTSGYGLDTN